MLKAHSVKSQTSDSYSSMLHSTDLLPNNDDDSSISLGLEIFNSLKSLFKIMTSDGSLCYGNCSGRGECQNGTCFCRVQYEGDLCTQPNITYFAAFAAVYYLIATVSLGQLLICIRAEYLKLKTPNLKVACKITTQKLLYILIFLASVLRGAYFSVPSNEELSLASSFLSIFYPIILSMGSLIVCFWAEVFHLRNIRCDHPRFLSKSIFGFLAFNFITYSLFITEVIVTKYADDDDKDFLAHIFTGCYAVLLFIVVVFFLVYGVEVYFKIRGGFVSDTVIVGNVQSRVYCPVRNNTNGATPLLNSIENCKLIMSGDSCESTYRLPSDSNQESSAKLLTFPAQMVNSETDVQPPPVDHSQLKQSQFGLVFQACMLMITVCFLFSDVLGEFWKNKVNLISRNAYDIIFRIVELAVALWFPCVLWNCVYPEQLWILNPKNILKKLDIEKTQELGSSSTTTTKEPTQEMTGQECWICYDSEKVDAGPLIEPCDCKGDVAVVHHNCLQKWLMECVESRSTEQLSCKVCGSAYQLERKQAWWIGQGFTARHWFQTVSLVTLMCGTVIGTWAVIHVYEDNIIRTVTAGTAVLLVYICLRFLGFNAFTAYQRAKMSAVKILGRHFTSQVCSAKAGPSISNYNDTHQNLSENPKIAKVNIVNL